MKISHSDGGTFPGGIFLEGAGVGNGRGGGWEGAGGGARQHSFPEIDHEIFSIASLSIQQIQEGQLSVSGKRMHKYWLTA